MHDAYQFLQTLALVLCAAAVTTVLFQRLKQPVVLGYLLAGLVIGPYIPIPLAADTQVVQALAELGVVLLMFSLGIEFSLQKLLRVGPTAVFVAIVQCSLLIWVGYLAGQAFGWSRLASFYAGAVISMSSTTIIIKAFEEQQIKADFRHIVFGVLIVEDLIAILLIAVLTPISAGEEVTALELGVSAGRLALFLCLLLVIGLLTVPRLIRAVVRLDRAETTVVASVGLAFGFALLAAKFHYSVALGAFIAGSLVAESGVEEIVEHLVRPVRDIFAAIFFVSVGMLIDPREIATNWLAVLVFFLAVVVGKICSVTVSAFLTGQSVQNSVKSGMSLAQIGEFSFIIAGVGMATGATDKRLYSIAVAVSGLTTMLTPWLIRSAQPTAKFIDRKLPRALQTFVALYGTWLEQLGTRSADEQKVRMRRMMRWLVVDAIVVAAIIIAASIEMETVSAWGQKHLNIPVRFSKLAVVMAALAASSPFWIGMIRVARYLGFELADRVFPTAKKGTLDLAVAPRRLLVVTLQLAIVVVVGFPLVAITQPFLPPLRGGAVLLAAVSLLAISFWRGASNFQGHTKAAVQAIAEALAKQTREGKAAEAPQPLELQSLEDVNRIVMGLGTPIPLELPFDSDAVGKTLAEINLRGLTGATVLAIRRHGDSVLVPSGHERLLAGDVLAIAGTQDAIDAARELLQVSA